MTVRDKLWLFASRAHDDDISLGKSMNNRFTRRSRITPAEGAAILDIPNVIMIVSDGMPPAYSSDAYGYLESFYRMKNVVWSIVGSGGFRAGNEEKFVCDMVKRYPNITGVFADDFLGSTQMQNRTDDEKRQMILDIRHTLDSADKPLSMWLTLYAYDLDTCDTSLYGLFDSLSLWTWEYKDLDRLPERFALMEEKFPAPGVAAYALMAAGGDLGASIAPQMLGVVVDTTAASGWAQTLAPTLSLSAEQLGMKVGMLTAVIFPVLGVLLLLYIRRYFKKTI